MRSLFRRSRRLFIYLVVANFLVAFGHRIWQAVFNNFAVERIGVGPEAIGWIQSVREVPGLLALTLAFLALVLSELRIMAVSVVLLGLGIVLTGQSSTVPTLLIATLVMSFGFHFFQPCNTSVLLMSMETRETPKALGQLRSLAAGSAVLATAAVYLLADRMGYRGLFLAVGVTMIVGGVALFPLGRGEQALPSRRAVRLRKRYWLFYALAFLMGSRRHIFTTFAPFLLVMEHAVSVRTMAVLFLVNGLINTYAHQLVGRLVGRWGERRMLSIAFAALVPVFLGYAYASRLPILSALFVLDNVLFGFNLGLTTYMQKIAVSPAELTSNLAAHETINHVSAVVVPVLGGTIWVLLGKEAPFLLGVGIAVVSLFLVQFLRVRAVELQDAAAPS
jgi:predicted MFS family arabinose efflux permease